MYTIVLTLLAGLLTTTSARADAVSDARSHYERALRFYDEGVYDAALVELTRAYDLNPSFRIVYNIAQAKVAMHDHAGAIESFQRYLREGAGQVPNDRVAAVRAQLSELQQRVGSLTVETDVAGSEVAVDEAVVGTAPLSAAVLVNAGVRHVSVRHADYPARSERVSIAGGEQQRVSLPLRQNQSEPQAAAPKEPAAPAELAPENLARSQPLPAADTDGSRTGAWVMTGVTGAFAATALVCALVANGRNNDLEARRTRPGEDEAQFNADRDALKRTALLADAFTLAALASAGVTTWLWLRDDGRPEHAHGVRIGLVGAGAQLRGEF